MQKTTNLQLNKPDEEDFYDIHVQNENMDIIDAKITSTEKALEEIESKGMLTSKVIGEDITITYAANAPIREFKVDGSTEQEGEPTPNSPQEIKGIGENGNIEVTVTGKNLFGGLALANKLVEVANATLDESNGTVKQASWSSHKQELYTGFKKDTQYTFILSVIDTTTVNLAILYTDGTYVGAGSISNNKTIYTSEAGKTVQAFCTYWYDGDTTLYYDKCGIFEGVLTFEDFEEYKSQTVSIPIDTPLYEDDYIHLKNGKLEVIRNNAKVVFNGSESFSNQTEYDTEETFLISLPTSYGNGINNRKLWCDHFRPVNHAQSTKEAGTCSFNPRDIYSAYLYFNVPYSLVDIDTTATSNEAIRAWKVWLSKNPITLVYQLIKSTAEIIDTGIDLSTYSNVTHISNTDNANMEVEYYVYSENGEVIGDLQKEIRRLEKLILESR